MSVEGQVEVQLPAQAGWRSISSGSTACRGDLIRVGPFSRAALRLPDKSLFRIDQNTQLRLPDADATGRNWVDLIRGIIHIISRDPRELGFSTPWLNAGLEGTEFVLNVGADSADVTVLEGLVSLESGDAQIEVRPGEQGSAGPTRQPAALPVGDPFAATRWTPYSARILTDAAPLPAPAARADPGDADALIRLAASRIGRGALDVASADLALAAAADPGNPGVPAHAAMIALERADKVRAHMFAMEAIALDPTYEPAWLALSYVDQAEFDYAAALVDVRQANTLAPASAVVTTRLAEIELVNGNYRTATATAESALRAAPDYGPAHAIHGFAALAGSNTADAIESFREAARLDPGSPVPRFGLALALLRQGETVAGRDELEVAVVLDPTNAAIRNLMAKIYANEGRIELANAQLDIALALDSADATALLYRVLTEQRANHPVAALKAFDAAAALNDEAPMFQTNLRLDSDAAVRELGFSRLFRELGFDAWALREGWRATSVSPTDYAGHRLLSDAYAYLPRHEVARVNEHYMARLLQPLSQNPVAPQLGEPNLYLLDDLGPSELAGSEFVGFVPSNGVRLRASAVGAGLDTGGYDFALTGLGDRLAYGFGHLYFETDGFRPNNDLTQRVSNGFVQFQPNAETSMIAELRHSESDQGSLQLLFDPSGYSPNLRANESIDSIRLGLRRSVGIGTLLVSANVSEAANMVSSGPGFSSSADGEDVSLEVQHLLPLGRWSLTSGIYSARQDDQYLTLVSFLPPGAPPGTPPLQTQLPSSEMSDELSVYSYGRIELSDRVEATIGLAADRIAIGTMTAYDTNPKLGVRFDVTSRTTLRAALTSSTLGRILSRRSIQPRLEPTHVAGFNQILTGSQGERAWRLGTALDHRVSDTVYAGIEVSLRDADWKTQIVDPFGNSFMDPVSRKELLQYAFVQWLPGVDWTLSAAYQRDRFDIDGLSLTEGFAELNTRRMPIEVNYFPFDGLSARARLTYVRQSGRFTAGMFDPTVDSLVDGSDRFAVLDLALAYKLRNGRGQITLSIDNALDEEFLFQDIDPENPNIIPARIVALRFTVRQ